MEARRTADTGRKARLLTLDSLDGRTMAVRRVREAEASLVSDLGGAEVVTEAQRQLVRRAAVLSAILEDAESKWAGGQQFDLTEYTVTVNAHRRLAATLGLERRQRRVDGILGIR